MRFPKYLYRSLLHVTHSKLIHVVFFKEIFFQVRFFVSLDLKKILTFKTLKGFKNIITLSAFDRASYLTDKTVLHISFSFYQLYFEIMGWDASYMIPG